MHTITLDADCARLRVGKQSDLYQAINTGLLRTGICDLSRGRQMLGCHI